MSAVFQVECDKTKPGEAVFLVGDHEALGNWTPGRAVRLATSSADFPQWTSPAVPILGDCSLEFKFLIQRDNADGGARWEEMQGNHSVKLMNENGLRICCHWGQKDNMSVVSASKDITPTPARSRQAPSLAVPEPAPEPPLSPVMPPARAVAQPAATPRPGAAPSLRLRLPDAGGGRVVACGGAPALGAWNPATALPLEPGAGDGEWVLRHTPDGVAPGTPFKFVVLAGGNARWEDSRGNRSWPDAGGAERPPLHCFDQNSPRRAAAGEELVIEWGDASTLGGAGDCPSAIFHAFNWQFSEVARQAKDIAAMGFDAVQLSPAQRSVHGDQWWTRYQPQRYEDIHGLGGENELREACSACARAGLRVLGDLVFNHMQVVASCDEWRRAQHDHGHLEHLKGRLDSAFGPTFNRDDFQWPWFELQGSEWDGPMRMEGWGCGEWSELRAGSPKVVGVHKAHMEKLRACGVDGFRFDAAKHMRPEHLSNYSSIAYSLPPAPGRQGGEASGTFVFGEVLSIDPKMQREYQDAHPAQHGPYSTTDFLLGVWLRRFLEGGEGAVDFSQEDWVRHLLEVEQGNHGSRQPSRCSGGGPCRRLTAPLLARNSVRFARNHDTVCNDVPFYGLGGWAGDAPATATAWLLAAHDGAVIILADDVRVSHLARRALLYRRALRQRLAALGGGAASARTVVRAARAQGGGPPLTVCIACHVGESGSGSCAGFCVLGVGPQHGAPVEFSGSAALAGGGAASAFRPGDHADGKAITVGADGQLAEPILVDSGGGVFFVAA